MASELVNKDYKEAVQKGLPEAYVPIRVLESIDKGFELPDDLSVLRFGYRISPVGIRTLLFAACNGVYREDSDYLLPIKTFQARTSALLYGYFNDMFSMEEFGELLRGKRIEGMLAETRIDMVAGPTYSALGNKIFPTIDEVAIDIERKRQRNPDIKVILVHGKWNNIPHPGHIILTRDVCNEVSARFGIDHKNMVVVVSCDTNSFIKASGAEPYLNTLWRASFMSYLPWVDYVTTSGEYPNGGNAAEHWAYKYWILKPDYINIDPESKNFDEIKSQVETIGAEAIFIERLSAWLPKLNVYRGTRVENPISGSSIKADKANILAFEREFKHLLAVKDIRDKLYGPRKLFVPNNLITIDKSRTVFPVSVQVPPEPGPQHILVSEKAQPVNEQALRFALASI
jgi:glycerol-3-phosphate cytidylyltransferase-like family protein